MIETVHIANFRSFAKAELNNCRRINVVIGDNGSGKTALLEGLFLAVGRSPEIAMRLRGWRGFNNEIQGSSRQVQQALWRDWFHHFNTSEPAQITVEGSHRHNRRLVISFRPGELQLPLSKDEAYDAELGAQQIAFTYYLPGQDKGHTLEPKVINGNLVLPPLPFDAPTEAYFFASNRNYPAVEAAGRLSELSRALRKEEILQAFRRVFRNIKDLSVELIAGSPAVFAELEGYREKIPLALASGAMNKVASVLLAMPLQRGCLYLIDELENGIFYSRLPTVWQALLEFSERYDGQIFASTHSAECLQAAASIAEKRPDVFSVIHAGPDGLRQFSGDKFVDAMNFNIEIR